MYPLVSDLWRVFFWGGVIVTFFWRGGGWLLRFFGGGGVIVTFFWRGCLFVCRYFLSHFCIVGLKMARICFVWLSDIQRWFSIENHLRLGLVLNPPCQSTGTHAQCHTILSFELNMWGQQTILVGKKVLPNFLSFYIKFIYKKRKHFLGVLHKC